jgi:hypothetical protein
VKNAWIVVAAALGLVALLASVAGLDYLIFRGLELGAVTAPKPNDVPAVTIPQSWDDDTRHNFHTTSQGTRVLPRSWLLALREPSPDPIFPGGKLASRDYLSRFGFTYDTKSALPIGFTTEVWKEKVDYVTPTIEANTEMVGLNCAACHTGRLDFDLRQNGRLRVLIEGGSAMINLGGFQDAVGQALFWTSQYRLKSFIEEVQKYERERPDAKRVTLDAEAEAKQIERDVEAYIKGGMANRDYAKEHKLNPVEAGFGRTDALGLIGNRVFGLLNEENQSVVDAPVNFPHLWDTAWFDWVQYNGSIRTPLSRNIGEALGVGAGVKLGSTLEEFKSTINIENLFKIEDWLGGREPFVRAKEETRTEERPSDPPPTGTTYDGGLQPPRWDDLRAEVLKAGGLADPIENEAMTIKEELRCQGECLYQAHCVRCHLPPRSELAKARTVANENSHHWEVDPRSGKTFLRLRVVDLDEIGTDPNQAVNFYRRFSAVPNPRLGLGTDGTRYHHAHPIQTISAAEGLYRITSFLRAKAFTNDPGGNLFVIDPQNFETRLKHDRFRTLPVGEAYDVRLISCGDAKELPLEERRGVIFIVKERGLRFQAPDAHYDKHESELRDNEALIDKLRTKLNAAPYCKLWDVKRMSPVEKGELLKLVAPITGLFGEEILLNKPEQILNKQAMNDVIRANLGYKARPLDGVWATPPFFHNGSVPNLDQVLSPASKRDVKFYLGTTRFDPVKVGYKTEQFYGAFLMDTTLPGNRNTGHEFRNLTLKEFEDALDDGAHLFDPDDPATIDARWNRALETDVSALSEEQRWQAERDRTARILDDVRSNRREIIRNPKFRGVRGVLGPEFTLQERKALVEYLKSL